MGGTNEQKIGGLRAHLKVDEIHFHDDAKSLKLAGNKGALKTKITEALDVLKKINQGVVKVEGYAYGDVLYLIKDENRFFTVLAAKTPTSEQTDIETFLKGL